MSRTTVIYHSADYDGIFCCEIARKFLGEKDVRYIGWNFGDPTIATEHGGTTYVLDLSPDCLMYPPLEVGTIWIDHHKTSIEKWSSTIPGYRIDGVAACRLAWQWFTMHVDEGTAQYRLTALAEKQDFIDRKVSEPLAVRLAGEYDVWDKRDPDAETFQYGLRAQDEINWDGLFGNESQQTAWTGKYILDGFTAQKYARNTDASICNSLTWLMEWEGLNWLCVNHARFNSLFFAAKDVPETGHDALLGFRFDGKNWMVSLYHAKHRTDLDLSTIAVKYGGGGHRGACGFTCTKLPFLNV